MTGNVCCCVWMNWASYATITHVFVHVVFWVDLLVQRRLCPIFVKSWFPERNTIYIIFPNAIQKLQFFDPLSHYFVFSYGLGRDFTSGDPILGDHTQI